MPQPVLLQHQDVGRPGPGEPVGRRAAERARANHDVAVSTCHLTGIPRFRAGQAGQGFPVSEATWREAGQ